MNLAGSSTNGSWPDCSNQMSLFEGAVKTSMYAMLISWRDPVIVAPDEEEYGYLLRGYEIDGIQVRDFWPHRIEREPEAAPGPRQMADRRLRAGEYGSSQLPQRPWAR
jgi:hypothetical protein